MKYPIRVSVVQADVPLLLGLDFQTKLGIVLDIANKTIHVQKSGETFKMGPGNYWKLPIQSKTITVSVKTHGRFFFIYFNFIYFS